MTESAALSALMLKMLVENGLVSRDVVRQSLATLRVRAEAGAAGDLDRLLAALDGASGPVGGARVPDAVQIAGLEEFVDRLVADAAPGKRSFKSVA